MPAQKRAPPMANSKEAKATGNSVKATASSCAREAADNEASAKDVAKQESMNDTSESIANDSGIWKRTNDGYEGRMSNGPKRRRVGSEDSQGRIDAEPRKRLVRENDIHPLQSSYSIGEYTVGWICAITAEYIAARAFLDEKHDPPEDMPSHDNNVYTLGKVGRHNVVIAVLPDGEYGIAAAASVAGDLLHSFPNIRIGLMVGIGGGSPSQSHDIRLGDIVVSKPEDGRGGVFQYDFGKTIQEQKFQTTGFLNQPPRLLRAAVSDLRAQYEEEGHRLEDAVNVALEKKPRLRMKYKRPDSSTDRLFKSAITHSSSCETACGNSPSNLVSRPDRTEDDDNPAIHYGLIASANQLMKDATVRDKLAAEKGVLCFEMEAAGLMNHFPCLVIRGICDYSDSHKNKEWQGYAAMVAAAYAKDLLCRIPPNEVKSERRISELLSDVLNTVSRTRANIERMKCKLESREDLDVLNWLTPIDYAPQQSDYIRRRQKGTGQWLLDSVQFQAWLKGNTRTLFCPGIPGAGKTILTSIVIDELSARFRSDSGTGIAYIYCNFRQEDNQKVENLLASLLKQLAESYTSLPKNLKDLYDQHKPKRTSPSFDEIARTLRSVTELYSRLFIIVDALDECQPSDRKSFLEELFNLQTRQGAKIFVTSRSIPEIVDQPKSSILEIRASREDVERYLEGNMDKLLSFVRRDRSLQEDIKKGISEAVDGMFLLAQIYLDTLDDKTTPKAIRDALEYIRKRSQGLGKDREVQMLADAYDQTMERINSQKLGLKRMATRVLSWITCAKRPLTTSELQHALAVEVGKTELDEQNFTDIETMVSVCAGLVTVDEESKIIRLVHYTTQEYFEQEDFKQKHDRWFLNADQDIANTCLAYLSFNVFGAGPWQNPYPHDKYTNQVYQYGYPFYKYAAQNWGHHVQAASMEAEPLVLNFLGQEDKVCASSQIIVLSTRYVVNRNYMVKQVKGIHLAAHFGLRDTVMALMRNGHDPDPKDSFGGTPLLWAARSGHDKVVELLLEQNGVNPDSRGPYTRTPLSYAAEQGHEVVVGLLLKMGKADPNSETTGVFSLKGQTPLWWAAERGHKAVVQRLLEEGADLEPRDSDGVTPMLLAAGNGHDAVVQLLLKKGADPEPRDSDGVTPMLLAAGNGHDAVVQLLLKEGVGLGTRDSYGNTPASWAIRNRHEPVIKLLLEKSSDSDYEDQLSRAAESGSEALVELLLSKKGVDINAKDGHGRTPLSLAAGNGHEGVVKLLFSKDGVNINAKDEHGQTALSWAATAGYEAMFDLLLGKYGVDVNATGHNYCRTLLWWAAEKGYQAIIELLLDKDGIDINAQDYFGQTLLSKAAEKGHEAVVELLLNKDGVDINAKQDCSQILLWWAAEKGHKAVVELLLDKYGVDINAKDERLLSWSIEDDIWMDFGRTALLWTAANGHIEVVKLLLSKNGVDINAKDDGNNTALLLAVTNENKAVVRLLLGENGIDINAKDGQNTTALILAAAKGDKATVQLLLSKDSVDINAVDDRRRTALSWAAGNGNKAVVKLLLSEKDIDVNGEGDSPLWMAAKNGHKAVFDLLLSEDGVDVNVKRHRRTLLLWAAKNGHAAIVKQLLDKGADLESKDTFRGRAPLSHAAEKGHRAIVELLLEHGAEIETMDKSYRTPLSWAAEKKHTAVIKLLLEHGAKTETKDT